MAHSVTGGDPDASRRQIGARPIMTRAVLPYAAILAGLSLPALAQVPPEDNYQPQPSYPQQQAPNGPRLSSQELSNLVAPVALYPDLLLSEVLAASTYPAEIAQA